MKQQQQRQHQPHKTTITQTTTAPTTSTTATLEGNFRPASVPPVLPKRRLQLEIGPVLYRLHAIDQRNVKLAATVLPFRLPSPSCTSASLGLLQQQSRPLNEAVVQEAHLPQGGRNIWFCSLVFSRLSGLVCPGVAEHPASFKQNKYQVGNILSGKKRPNTCYKDTSNPPSSRAFTTAFTCRGHRTSMQRYISDRGYDVRLILIPGSKWCLNSPPELQSYVAAVRNPQSFWDPENETFNSYKSSTALSIF